MLFSDWHGYIENYLDNCKTLVKPFYAAPVNADLNSLEQYYKRLDLYYSFSKTMGLKLDSEWIQKEKMHISEAIHLALVKDIQNYRIKCKCCGKPLFWKSQYKICEKCYENMYY